MWRLTFTTILPVSDNRRLSQGQGRWFASDNYASAVSRIRGDTVEAGFRPQKGVKYKVAATVYFPNKRGDLTNILKGLADGIFGSGAEGGASDHQIEDIRLIRKLDKDRPRVEVEITTPKSGRLTEPKLIDKARKFHVSLDALQKRFQAAKAASTPQRIGPVSPAPRDDAVFRRFIQRIREEEQ